jgi:hypothetical protein
VHSFVDELQKQPCCCPHEKLPNRPKQLSEKPVQLLDGKHPSVRAHVVDVRSEQASGVPVQWPVGETPPPPLSGSWTPPSPGETGAPPGLPVVPLPVPPPDVGCCWGLFAGGGGGLVWPDPSEEPLHAARKKHDAAAAPKALRRSIMKPTFR